MPSHSYLTCLFLLPHWPNPNRGISRHQIWHLYSQCMTLHISKLIQTPKEKVVQVLEHLPNVSDCVDLRERQSSITFSFFFGIHYQYSKHLFFSLVISIPDNPHTIRHQQRFPSLSSATGVKTFLTRVATRVPSLPRPFPPPPHPALHTHNTFVISPSASEELDFTRGSRGQH